MDCCHTSTLKQRKCGQDPACWAARRRNHAWLCSSVQGHHSEPTPRRYQCPSYPSSGLQRAFDLPSNQNILLYNQLYTTVIKSQVLVCIHSLECASTLDNTGLRSYKTWGRPRLASALASKELFSPPFCQHNAAQLKPGHCGWSYWLILVMHRNLCQYGTDSYFNLQWHHLRHRPWCPPSTLKMKMDKDTPRLTEVN